jgi:hypothetical protein
MRSHRLSDAERRTPHPKSANGGVYGMASATHSARVGAPIAESSLTVRSTTLYSGRFSNLAALATDIDAAMANQIGWRYTCRRFMSSSSQAFIND